MKILAINPGSTSTKLSVYEDENEIEKRSAPHSNEELRGFSGILDQLEYRYGMVMDFLRESGHTPESFDCVVSRGGTPRNARSGATKISEALLKNLREDPKQWHPSNLGPMIASRIAGIRGVPAFICDPITTDELNPLARTSGVKEYPKESLCHVLNTRAVAIEAADEIGKSFNELSAIVVHIGGGNSVCLWKGGRLDDTISADEGPFSAERCGHIRGEALVNLCEELGFEQVKKWMMGSGGVVSLLGTNDLRVAEDREQAGDPEAVHVCAAMAYHLSRSIGSLAPVTCGKIDAIIFTGGGAYWKSLVGQICERVKYLNAPIFMKPGENEMKSLAMGALRVMRGQEEALDYME